MPSSPGFAQCRRRSDLREALSLMAGSRGRRGPSHAQVKSIYLGALNWGFLMRRVHLSAVLAIVTLFVAASWPPAAAQERRVPDSLSQLQLSYAPIVQRVAPAVVNVYATH